MKALQNLWLKFQKQKAIKSALSCQGWTNERKLSLLFDLAKATEHLPGDILEIGSAWGRSLVNLGFASNKTIWSIDPHTGGIIYINKGENQNSFEKFIKNLEKFNLTDRVKILKNTTREVIEQGLIPQATKFSLVWIDGLHTAEGVKTDFDLAYKHLSPQGIIAFDDYFNQQNFPGYAEMIDQLMKDHQIILTKNTGTGLVYCQK